MINASDLKRGGVIELDGAPCSVLDVTFQSPSARGANTLVKIKYRNLLTGQVLNKSFKTSDKINEADFLRRKGQFLYASGEGGVFMDLETYEQFEVGADLDFIVSRRAPDKPGTGVVFLTPLRGDAEIAAAAELGFNVTSTLHAVRVEGDNEPGIAALLTAALADAKINLRGLSAAVIDSRFIIYLGLDNAEDAAKAVDILKQL